MHNNYRGITLSLIFGKLCDLIVLAHYNDRLVCCDTQFGFRAKRSTGMRTMTVKEAISHSVAGGSQVICTFINATKAFDKIEYGKLFNLMFCRNLP